MITNTLRHALNWIRHILRNRREMRQITDQEWRTACQKSRVPFDMIECTPANALLLRLNHSSIKLPKTLSALRVLSGYSYLYDLEAHTGCLVEFDEQKDVLILQWGQAKYLVDSLEELHTLREIYLAGDYDFTPAESTVLLDIGANVGFTSIFLADINPDLLIVACEPLPENYLKALNNLAANPQLSGKISLHNYGVFSEDGQKTIVSEIGNRVRSSIVIDQMNDTRGAIEYTSVKVRRASDLVLQIRALNPTRQIVIKMDCEGSEYEILRNLETDGAINFVSGVLMEWHKLIGTDDNSEFIRAFFKRSGFNICMHGRTQSKSDIGMAYAFRTNGFEN